MWQVIIITTTTHRTSYLISLPINATIRRIFHLNYSPSVSGPIKSDIFIVSVDTHNEPSTNLFAHQSLNSPPNLESSSQNYPFETAGNTNGDRSYPFPTKGSCDVGIGFGFGGILSVQKRSELSLSLTFTLDYFDEKEENVLSLALFYLF